MSKTAISVENLSKNYNGVQAVKSISFTVPEGTVFGFLGPNGAGKTTTMKMLCTLLRPTGGEAWVAGFNVLRHAMAVRRSIGIVFQDPSLDDRLTAHENLQFHGILYGMRGAALRKKIVEMLELVELSDKADARVRTFSGGMKRRLEIARGLIHTPKVLFLDEPTIGLDPQTRVHIWDYLHSLRKKEPITLFLTTHYLEEAEGCDQIAVIDHGKMIALDTPSRLKAKIRGNVVFLKTEENEQTAEFLRERFQCDATTQEGGVRIELSEPEKFLPGMLRELPVAVHELHLYRPTLEDVFLDLTGSEIREESASWRDVAKRVVRRR